MPGHPVFARVYRRLADAMEHRGEAEHRRRLVAGLHGRVLEVGPGHGINFSYYPREVDAVTAVEPEPWLRAAASEAAAEAPVPVEVCAGVAEQLPFDDGVFDAAVVSLVLCSVADPEAAVHELQRVLRPGGELRFYEHVRAQTRRLARVQVLADRVWPHLAGGCHTARDTVAEIEEAGFVVEELDRFHFPASRLPQPASPHVLGRALATGRDARGTT